MRKYPWKFIIWRKPHVPILSHATRSTANTIRAQNHVFEKFGPQFLWVFWLPDNRPFTKNTIEITSRCEWCSQALRNAGRIQINASRSWLLLHKNQHSKYICCFFLIRKQAKVISSRSVRQSRQWWINEKITNKWLNWKHRQILLCVLDSLFTN